MFPSTNNAQTILSKIPEALSKGTSGIIILPQNPNLDGVAAACSLYLGLTKMGKNVTIACSSPVQGDFVGLDKIQSNISTGGDNLVISFPYKEGALEKVDYGVQGDFFNIIITPRPGQAKLQPDKVKYSYTGGTLDFIFTIDAPNLNSLGQLYKENQNEFAGKTIINIDRHLVNDQYGVINYVVKTASSTSELVMKVLQTLQVPMDRDIATNLYTGITVATNNFTAYSVNADTFEAASSLLKFGAVKKPLARPGMPPQQPPAQQFGNPFGTRPMNMPVAPVSRPAPANTSFSFPLPQGATGPMTENMRPIEDVEDEPMGEEEMTPQDWLKPKIFKGGGLV